MSLSQVKNRSKIKLTCCPMCHSKKIKECQGEYTEGGIFIPYLEWYYCPDCKEEFYDSDAMETLEEYQQ